MNLRVKSLCWLNGVLWSVSLLFLLKFSFKGCISKQQRNSNVATEQYLHEISLRRTVVRYYTPEKDETTNPTTLPQPPKATRRQKLLTNPLSSLENIILSLQEKFSANAKKLRGDNWKTQDFSDKATVYREPTCGRRKPFLLIEVHSRTKNFLARQAIRMTWGKQRNKINELYHDKRFTWKTVFLVGKAQDENLNLLMMKEASQHNDIVIGDFLDTYRNLTYKTLLTIEYPSKHCHNAQYIMKTDDDCYINVKSVIKWLASQQKSHQVKPFYMGRIHWDNKPSRGNSSKFYVTREEYKGDVYPPYAAGGGYVFTGSLLPKLLQTSKSTAVFPMEDAYFGLLMQNIGVNATNHRLVMPYTFCECKIEGECQLWSEDSLCNIAVAMVIHDVRPDEQVRTHINVMIVNSVQSICKHEKGRNSWDKKKCDFSKIKTSD